MNEILRALAKDLGVFSEAEKAAKDRDTSRVQWRFLGDVLRKWPTDQKILDPIIRGMDMMAAGEKNPVGRHVFVNLWGRFAAAKRTREHHRQREALLRMIAECPSKGESE